MPKVSVIIPTYNYGKYIEKAIDSVLAQTYKDFEIIVVDDGSSDNTKEIIGANYKEKVSYLYQEKKGAPAARNYGFKKSRGEYLVFLDADDLFHPLNLEKKAKFLDSNLGFQWVYSDCHYIIQEGLHLKKKATFKGFCAEKKLDGNIFRELAMGLMIPIDTVMLRKSVLGRVGIFDETLRSFQDYDLWLRIASQYKIGFIDEKLCYVLYHQGSVSTSTDRESAYRSKIAVIEKVEHRYPHLTKNIGWKWKKTKADGYNFLVSHYMDKSDLKNSWRCIKESIFNYPVQKGVYFSLLRYIWRRIFPKTTESLR